MSMGDEWTNIPCSEVERYIPWLLDDELDRDQAIGVEAHLGECAECRAVLESEGRLRLALRRAAHSIAAPARLHRRLNEAIALEHSRTQTWTRRWPAVAAAAILLAFVWRGATSESFSDLREAAARHAGNLPMDVVAADMGPVQKYFSGKLPFAVNIPSLTEESPSELGGRVIQLNNHDAAYVRYETPRGRVSIFVYEGPSSGLYEAEPVYRIDNQPFLLKRVRGYTTLRWLRNGLVYSVVADLPERELLNGRRSFFRGRLRPAQTPASTVRPGVLPADTDR